MDSRVTKHFPDHTHAHTHTCTHVPMNALACGPSHKHTYPLLNTLENKSALPPLFSFLTFLHVYFLKRTYPNIWIINHLRFLRNWLFFFPCGFCSLSSEACIHSFILSFIHACFLPFFFPFFFFSLHTGDSSFSELNSAFQRGPRIGERSLAKDNMNTELKPVGSQSHRAEGAGL